ncbi:MAG: NHLP bacteriocin export ABC transporter permease/ATPase subunit [Rhodoferax sp.]
MAPTLTPDAGRHAGDILLSGSDAVWLIEDGRVDLFVVPLLRGQPDGPREHVCRLAAGQFFLGVGAAELADDLALIAVGLTGARITKQPATLPAQLQRLQQAPQGGVDAAGVLTVGALEQWLACLASGFHAQAPHGVLEVHPGEQVDVARDDQLAAGEARLVWLDAAALPLQWMPMAQLIEPASVFPLAPGTWVRVGGAAQLACHSTQQVLEAGLARDGLAAFDHALLAALRQRMAGREQQILQRIQRRTSADDRIFGNALASMASVLATASADRLTLGTRSVDPLLSACQQVMQARGIRATLQAPTAEGGNVIEQLARQARVSYRAVSLSADRWWRDDAGPLLAYRKSDAAPLALLPDANRGYWLLDPGAGLRQRLDRDNAADVSDTAFMFFANFPDKAMGMTELLRFGMIGSRTDLVRLLGYGAMGGLLGLFTPYATHLLIDSVIPSAHSGELLQLVLLLLTSALGISAFELVRALAMLRIDSRIDNATQAAIIDRLMHLPVPFFRRYSAGDLAQRAFGIASILQLISNNTQSALLSWTFGLFSYFYLFFINLQMALLASAVVALALLFTTLLNLWRLNLERQMLQVQGSLASRVLQILNGMAKLRGGGAEKRAFTLWAKDFSRQKELAFKARRISNMLGVFNAGYVVLSSLLLFALVAAYLPALNTGSFIAFNTAFAQFFAATIGLASALTASLSAVPLYERAKPILQTPPEVQQNQHAPGALSGALELSHVSFRYTADGPLIINDLSIRVKPGEFVALVGASGSGKSTVLRLLLGFEQPQSGAVYYDGQDLSGLDVRAVRRQMGVVLQNGKLMPGDIFTNIVGAAPLTLEDAWEAARMAGLEDDIKAMPMGMQTVIAEGAGTISGGQKQRLMVARAIVKKPRILLFDEATSALDNQTQAIVADSLIRLKASRVVIAHRLSTVIKADRIYVIDAGCVVEQGNYDSLMALQGRFAALAQRQIV